MAEFKIFTTSESGRLIIQDATDSVNQLFIGDIDSMKNLIARLEAWRSTLETDGHVPDVDVDDPWIQTHDARQLAADEGYDLAGSTVTRAAERGSLEGARRNGGRWEFRRSAFDAWFAKWRQRARS